MQTKIIIRTNISFLEGDLSTMQSNYTPIIWDEDEVPEEAIDYLQCEVCSPKSRMIWGEGNPRASIVIILDNPGEREDKEGQAYVCGTRQTLQATLHDVHLTPNDVYITYLLKCRPLGRYHKEEARAFSKPFLEEQIKKIQPKFLLCLGDVVVQSMFNNNKVHVKDLRGVWHDVMGFSTIVSYHPLAVRRRPNIKKNFMHDLNLLASRFH